MVWPFVDSELDNANVLGWVTPPVVVVAYFYLPGPLDGALVLFGAAASALLLLRRRRVAWQSFVAVLWCVSPLASMRFEAVVFESRVLAHLADFDTAAHLLLTGKLGPCWGPLRVPADCKVEQLPPVVAQTVVDIRTEKDSVRFGFKAGTRRGLVYAPRHPAKPLGPYRPIAPGWFFCRG